MNFENEAKLGLGIFTVPDLADILNIKYYKVSRLLNEYWDSRLASQFKSKYSWKVDQNKAVGFHTLVEFFIFYQFKEVGVSTRNILKAHQELGEIYSTPFPFAQSHILKGINCFGKKIVFEIATDQYIDLDSTKQLNLKFIRDFTKKLEFDRDNLAERLYPMGKTSSIVVDPKHKFGQPTIKGTNLYPETIYNLHRAKESKRFIASSYDISLKQVNDAIEYCKKAA